MLRKDESSDAPEKQFVSWTEDCFFSVVNVDVVVVVVNVGVDAGIDSEETFAVYFAIVLVCSPVSRLKVEQLLSEKRNQG